MNELHKAYAVLGLEPGSSMDSIMRRYKRLIMVWHPDRAPTKEHKDFAEEELKKINNAKDLLSKHFNGGHKATGCECQPGQTAGAGTKSSAGASAGPGPCYHQSKTAEEKQREDEAARNRDAARKRREQEEAKQKQDKDNQEYQKRQTQQSMQSAMQQQGALKDEKLRWQISIGIIIAFIGLEIFGSCDIGMKDWWHDLTWKWQQEHSEKPSTGGGITTPVPNPYIEPYHQTPGGNPTTWQQEQYQREREQKEREQKQHDQDVYFARLDIDKYQKIIDHCNTDLTNLAIQLASPTVSEFEKNKLREMRDFQQKNLEDAKVSLKIAQDKLAALTGETPTPTVPTPLPPFTTDRSGIPLVPIPSSNTSPFAPPAAPPGGSSLTPSTPFTPSSGY